MGNEAFQKRIRDLRLKRGLTVEALADALDVSKSRVSMWESRGAVPRDPVLRAAAEYFGVTTDYLLGSDDDEPGSDTLRVLQRGLRHMDERDLEKVRRILSAAFEDKFDSVKGEK